MGMLYSVRTLDCVYTAVSVAAKAKPWFNLRSHICVKRVDTTRFHVSFFCVFAVGPFALLAAAVVQR